jgi:hypothetical protein
MSGEVELNWSWLALYFGILMVRLLFGLAGEDEAHVVYLENSRHSNICPLKICSNYSEHVSRFEFRGHSARH